MKYMFDSLLPPPPPETSFASVHIWEVALEMCPETRVGLHAKMSRTLLCFDEDRNGALLFLLNSAY